MVSAKVAPLSFSVRVVELVPPLMTVFAVPTVMPCVLPRALVTVRLAVVSVTLTAPRPSAGMTLESATILTLVVPVIVLVEPVIPTVPVVCLCWLQQFLSY